nr:hypothetical protein [Tanacetum cinerariifolium]
FLLLFFNSSANFWQCHLFSSGSGKQSSLVVGTYTASGNSNLAVGMPLVTGPEIVEVEVPSAFVVIQGTGLKELSFSMTSHRA